MKNINILTSDPSQNFTIILDDGSKVNMTINYYSQAQLWACSLTHTSLITASNPNGQLNNFSLTTSLNMLRDLRGIIPFGLQLQTIDGYEPVFINDFSSGRAQLFILNSDDISDIEAQITAYQIELANA